MVFRHTVTGFGRQQSGASLEGAGPVRVRRRRVRDGRGQEFSNSWGCRERAKFQPAQGSMFSSIVCGEPLLEIILLIPCEDTWHSPSLKVAAVQLRLQYKTISFNSGKKCIYFHFVCFPVTVLLSGFLSFSLVVFIFQNTLSDGTVSWFHLTWSFRK